MSTRLIVLFRSLLEQRNGAGVVAQIYLISSLNQSKFHITPKQLCP